MCAESARSPRERNAVILARDYRCPRCRTSPASPSAPPGSLASRGHGRRGDRLLRRPLHGRDGRDPLPGEGCADPDSVPAVLSDSIDADQLRAWKADAGRDGWSCTSTPGPRSRPRPVTAAPPRTRSRWSSTSGAERGPSRRSCSAPTCRSARSSPERPGSPKPERCAVPRLGRRVPRPRRNPPGDMRNAEHAGAEFLIPPMRLLTPAMESSPPATSRPRASTCSRPRGCSRTSRRSRRRVHRHDRVRDALPLQQAAPQANLMEANRMALCGSMKITLPKVRTRCAS